MSTNEFLWLFGLLGVGAFVGHWSAVAAEKKSRSLRLAVGRALLVAVGAPLVFFFVAGFFEWPRSQGFSIGGAFSAAVGSLLLFGCGTSVISGTASLAFSVLSYLVSKQARRTPKS